MATYVCILNGFGSIVCQSIGRHNIIKLHFLNESSHTLLCKGNTYIWINVECKKIIFYTINTDAKLNKCKTQT